MSLGRAARYAVIIAAAVSWGFWALILRQVDSYGPFPTSAKATITLVVVTAVGGLSAVRNRSRREVRELRTLRSWSWVFWIAIADAFNVLLLFRAYQITSVAVAALTHYLAPIFVAIGAPLFLREKAGARSGLAIGISFAGLVLLLGPWSAGGGEHGYLGALCGAGSAVFYASNVMVNKHALQRFTPSELSWFHGLIAIPLLASFVPLSAWGGLDPRAIGVLVLGAIGPGAIAGLAFVWALGGVPVSHASTLTLIEPLVAVLLGAFVMGESMTWVRMLGGAVILLGAWLLVSDKRVAS